MSVIDIQDWLAQQAMSQDERHLERVFNRLVEIMEASDLDDRFLMLVVVQALVFKLSPADRDAFAATKKQISRILNSVTMTAEKAM